MSKGCTLFPRCDVSLLGKRPTTRDPTVLLRLTRVSLLYLRHQGKCKCWDGWTRYDCSEKKCPFDCQGGPRWLGVPSQNHSSGRSRGRFVGQGECLNGQCLCAAGWQGADCGEMTCPGAGGLLCSGRGACNPADGTCVCQAGWSGPGCNTRVCHQQHCLNGGQCVRGRCYCANGFTGVDCSQKLCPNECSGNGICSHSGRCACSSGWGGDDCSEPSCARNSTGALCSGRGDCVALGSLSTQYSCQCAAGWTGPACDEPRCTKDCHGHGACTNGKCICTDGYSGEDCSTPPCPGECSARGRCVNGECLCFLGFTGMLSILWPMLFMFILADSSAAEAVDEALMLSKLIEHRILLRRNDVLRPYLPRWRRLFWPWCVLIYIWGMRLR